MGHTALIHHDVYSPTPFPYHLCSDLFHFPITFSLGSFPLFRHIYNRTRSWRKKRVREWEWDLELVVIFCLLFLFFALGSFSSLSCYCCLLPLLPLSLASFRTIARPLSFSSTTTLLFRCTRRWLLFQRSVRTLPSWSLTPYSGVRGNHGLEIDTAVA